MRSFWTKGKFGLDYFFDLLVVGISLGMVYGLVALGISFIYSGLDIVHFAHGEVYMIGAFLGVTVLRLTGLNYPALILVAMVLTGLIGIVIERVFYRRLTREGGGISFAGMGISMVLQNVAFLIWTARAVPFPVNFGLPIEIGELMLPRSYLWIVAITILLMATLHGFLKYTRLGLAVRAVAYNKDIAYLMGINVPRMISLLFGIGCALAAAAGVLIGPINYVEVSMGIGILIKAFAAAVVGGFGNLPGAVLGGLLVGIVESLGAGYLSGNYKDIYAFILLIAVLMVKPSGLLGVAAKVKA
jgi:branched-chain amino acid transport system permease protein